MRTFILYSFLISAIFGCGNRQEEKETENEGIVITEASDFNAYFIRYGDGWTGGDVGFTIPLPDGRIVWVFGDTFLGTVSPDRSRDPQPLVTNTFMIQDGSNFTTLSGPNNTPLLVPQNPEEKYWPQDGFVSNNKLYVFLYTWKPSSQGGSFGYDFLRTDLAIFSLPDVTLQEIKTFSGNSVIWGAAIMVDGDYIYNYGSVDLPDLNQVNLSRAPINNPEGPWEYFSGFGWISESHANKTLLEGNSNQFSVFKHGDSYYLFTQEDIAFSNKVYRYKAQSPEGPFTDKTLVYETPNHGQDTWTYNTKAHPEFMGGDGELLISYNLNCLAFEKLFVNADLYRLYFVRAKNWE